MDDGILLQSIEGLGKSPFLETAGELWELLQREKKVISRKLLAEGTLWHSVGSGLQESEASEEYAREIEWLHRGQLEERLEEIDDAQGRLLDGTYGKCAGCGKQIDSGRLAADPAAPLCVECQRMVDGERRFHAL